MAGRRHATAALRLQSQSTRLLSAAGYEIAALFSAAAYLPPGCRSPSLRRRALLDWRPQARETLPARIKRIGVVGTRRTFAQTPPKFGRSHFSPKRTSRVLKLAASQRFAVDGQSAGGAGAGVSRPRCAALLIEAVRARCHSRTIGCRWLIRATAMAMSL